MENEAKYLYHICLIAGETIQIVQVQADSIDLEETTSPGYIELKLKEDQVAQFSTGRVHGWWKERVDMQAGA